MKQISKHALLFLAALMVLNFTLSSCESKDPSVLKVFVHDESANLLPKAQVIIIGDTESNPPTIDYVDTFYTDNLGVAVFNLEDFFAASGKTVQSGYFDILVKYQNKEATGRIRVKKHITSVQSIYFEP
ncbi:MAG: hypothetical protein K0R65_475 [Crocinitomicaceae bacterium]|jgi:hypothetical protein|nr:hypothetical protein [Crocinitomicaceae bacterium]